MNKVAILIALLLIQLLYSCKKEQLVKVETTTHTETTIINQTNGTTNNTIVNVAPFNKITLNGACDVVYIQDVIYKVEVIAAPSIYNIIDIKTENDSNLVINSALNGTQNFVVEVRSPSIVLLKLTSSGNIQVKNTPNVQTLTIENSGMGDVQIENLTVNSNALLKLSNSGSIQVKNKLNVNTLTVENSGIGDFQIENLTVKSNALLKLTSSGSIKVKNTLNVDTLTIKNSGLGDVNIDILTTTSLIANVNNSGSIGIFHGTAKSEEINISSLGNIIADAFAADDCKVISKGLGAIKVWVVNKLDVTIGSGGDVNYKGNPSIQSNITGLGKLNKI